jgi:hypothetical protein
LHKLLLLQPSHENKVAHDSQFVWMKSTITTWKPMCECHQSTKQYRLSWRIIYIVVRKLIYYHTYNYVHYKITLKRSCQKEKKNLLIFYWNCSKSNSQLGKILFIVLTPTSNSANLHFFKLQMPYPKVSFTIKYNQNSETSFCENMILTRT